MTRQVRVGNLKIGGGAPIVIQSMIKTDTRDVSATVKQIRQLEEAGCELIRVAVKDFEAASAIKKIKNKIKIPLCADIHFDYRLAVESIKNGADKIRLNPGNINKRAHILEVVKFAKKMKVPIRIGVNSGSVGGTGNRAQVSGNRYQVTGKEMVRAALGFIDILEKAGFYDIIVSLKASDILTTIDAYREFSKRSKYPLHLGVTAAGPVSTGLVKSAIGIGVLLLEGIGDTIRVSLTGDPYQEVVVGKNILQALRLRQFGPEIISCPTCGRCQVDLGGIVKDVEKFVAGNRSHVAGKRFPSIAIMGCEVNGPGEAKEADIGIACGKNSGILFKKGKILKRITEKEIVRYLVKELLS